jgi:probable HAF family extracellular repeat protein
VTRFISALALATTVLSQVAAAQSVMTCDPQPVPAFSEQTFSVVYDINNRGDIVGYGSVPGQSGFLTHAFLYRRGELQELPSLPDTAYAEARGINDEGLIVGVTVLRGTQADIPVYWRRGAIARLPLSEGSVGSARAVNNHGQIVGVSWDGHEGGCVIWNHYLAAPTRLPTLGGDTCQPLAINEEGTVVGYASDAANYVHAFIWRRGVMTDLGPADTTSTASDINNAGQIVGTLASSSDLSGAHPASWTRELSPRIYDYLGEATSINERGDIVMRTWSGEDGSERAWLVDRRGTFHQLPLPPIGNTLQINNQRRIIWNSSDPVVGTKGYTCELRGRGSD